MLAGLMNRSNADRIDSLKFLMWTKINANLLGQNLSFDFDWTVFTVLSTSEERHKKKVSCNEDKY